MFEERKVVYTPTRAAVRLKLLQRVASQSFDSNSVPKPVDKIVLVPGPDGRYNKLSQNGTIYLLNGSYGRELDNSTIESEPLEDTVLCVGKSSVDFYHSAALSKKESRITAKWPNKKQYRPNNEIVDDAEECELFKIKSFIHMVQGQETLGFPARKYGDQSSNSIVESWPLAQAYGLDEMKTGGFLTMKHNVIDVSSGLASLFSHVDAHALDRALSESVDRLNYHWETCVAMLDRVKLPSRRRRLSEADIGESLSTFFEFGQLRLRSQGGDNSLNGRERQPIVLFGKRSNLVSQNPPNTGEKAFFGLDDSSSIQSSGLHGRPALHMIIEGVDPATGITVARSYFLNNGIEPMEIVDPEALVERAYEDEEENGEESLNDTQKAKQDNLLRSERNDVQRLARIYNALVNGLKSICESKCSSKASGISLKQATELFQSISSTVLAKNLPDNFDFKNNLQISVKTFDASGRPIRERHMVGNAPIRAFTYVRVQLMNIPSSDNKGMLGSLIVGDTITHANYDSQAFIVTQQVPYVQSWFTSAEDIQAEKQITKMLVDFHARESVTSIGESISNEKISRVSVLLGGSFDPYNLVGTLKNCDVQFFQHGIAIKHHGYGTIVYSWASDVSCVKILHQQQNNEDAVSLLVLSLKNDASKYGFANLMDETKYEREIAVVLPEYDEIREAALSAMGVWQDQQNRDENVDVGVTFATQAGVSKHIGVLKNAYESYCSDWNRNCANFVENCLTVDINNTKMTIDGAPKEESKVASGDATSIVRDGQIPVTVLTGVPGCGKRSLGKAIIEYSSESILWGCYFGEDDSEQIKDLEDWLNENAEKFAEEPVEKGKEPRLLIVTPSLVTTKNVVEAISKFNAKISVDKLIVTSSIACINVGNTYHDTTQSQFIPGLIEMCAAGWTTHIAMMGCGNHNARTVEDLRAYLRDVNQSAEFIRISGGGMRVDEDFNGHHLVINQNELSSLLSLTSFHSRSFAKERCVTALVNYDYSDLKIRRFVTYPSLFKQRLIRFLKTITSPTSQLLSTNSSVVDENNRSGGASKDGRGKMTGGGNIFRQMQLAAKKKVLGSNSGDAVEDGMNRGDDRSVSIPKDFKCYSVSGFVKFVELPGIVHEFSAVNGKVRFTKVKNGRNAAQNTFVFYGENVQQVTKKLKQGLMSCSYQVPRNISRRTRPMVTDEEMQAIKAEHVHDPVIDGYYFDGTFYTDPTGDKREFPPNMESLVKEFLVLENEKIVKINAEYNRRRKDLQRVLSGSAVENADDLLLAKDEEMKFQEQS